MEQKDYVFEIVNVLSFGKNHVRGIATVLGINHMMISRKMDLLSKENVVDFVNEGRNKIYFLKKSPEAYCYFLMSKNYKLVRLLFRYPFLREVVEKIQRNKKIKMAFIFGSYAKGIEKKSSDVDFYLEGNVLDFKKEYSRLDSKFSFKVGVWDLDNLLIKEIIDNHVLIKGGEVYYEKVFG